MYFPLFVGVLSLSLFYALLCVSSFAIILKTKRDLVVLNVLFLMVSWVGMQCVCGISPSCSLTF